MQWIDKEEGPECVCDNPTIVVFSENYPSPRLMCLFHTYEAGALFALPEIKHPDWPDLNKEELIKYMKTAPMKKEEEE